MSYFEGDPSTQFVDNLRRQGKLAFHLAKNARAVEREQAARIAEIVGEQQMDAVYDLSRTSLAVDPGALEIDYPAGLIVRAGVTPEEGSDIIDAVYAIQRLMVPLRPGDKTTKRLLLPSTRYAPNLLGKASMVRIPQGDRPKMQNEGLLDNVYALTRLRYRETAANAPLSFSSVARSPLGITVVKNRLGVFGVKN